MTKPAFLRGDKVLLVLSADPEKNLQEETLECVILEGDSGREGQLFRAGTYTLQTRQASQTRDIQESAVLSSIKLEELIHL